MTLPPAQPKIYHITHVGNLTSIAADGALLSDSEMIARGKSSQLIGMSAIKRRRIEELEVTPHPGTKVGDYVPFYFCPRSVMLYVIHRANHPELSFRGRQEEIVHLEADFRRVIHWANENQKVWAFSLSNAGAYYTEFCSRVEELEQLNWAAIAASDFRASEIKEGKQAEFLLHGRFPLELADRIGVRTAAMRVRASKALADVAHQLRIEILPEWYF